MEFFNKIYPKFMFKQIIHFSLHDVCRDLPELTLEDFQTAVDLTQYRWIHFEVRRILM